MVFSFVAHRREPDSERCGARAHDACVAAGTPCRHVPLLLR
ncbi:hypothetical protein BURMUCGD2M_4290 [Burkholderia multivorans CGD2M]|uniref:Uncharacterized protein n=1 Tax=Burkholderia multivorans CGD2 TaxID=513052 RepID=B9C0T4_9BURK|nr:hypothetical protein BURMUCGD2_4300 [Burkholderia multivorans CGD2]EEE12325.1 hypothetical protein BURMUCGD2M_4290 [Burkholderia multivorans CGD2M]